MVNLDWVVGDGLEILYVLVILAGAFFLSQFFKFSLKRTAEKINLSRDTWKSAKWVVDLVIYSIAVIGCLYVLNFDVSTLLAGVGIMALAIGFAAQQLLANTIAGFIIIVGKPFRIGDKIYFEGGEGWVEEIGLRSTVIITSDKNMIYVPNSELVNSVVVNTAVSGSPTISMITFTFDPEVNLDALIKKIERIPEGVEGCIVDKAHKVKIYVKPIESVGKLRYKVDILFWVKNSVVEKGAVTEVTLKIKKLL
ncbi:mechanosensitive ion channel [Candidatus Micrarchaeota archaeon]|nr:mechanosensitive ion channel [Candidatus Micrarchaeota archaeon]